MLLARVADAKFVKGNSLSLSGDKGPAMLPTPMDAVLFETAAILAQFEPQRVAEILAGRPALKAALALYPKGRASMGSNTSTMSASGDDSNAMMGPFAAQDQFLKRVSEVARKDARAAVKLADEAGDAEWKARALSTVVETLGKDDPAAARAVMARAIEILPKLERPMSVLSLVTVALDEDLSQLLTPQLQQQLMEAFFASIGKFLKRDLDPDLPNLADRDEWPSTQLDAGGDDVGGGGTARV